MTPNLVKIMIAASSGFLSALLVDLQAYAQYRVDHPGAAYDFGTVVVRVAIGLITGLMTGIGFTAGDSA